MRAALALPLLLLLPGVVAAPEVYEHTYIVQGVGCGGGGALIRNCETYFPAPEKTNVTAEVSDVTGASVKLRICHEWTYDDGSHPTVWCKTGCSPSLDDVLVFPTSGGIVYRVIVDLRGSAGSCAAAATAGRLLVTFA